MKAFAAILAVVLLCAVPALYAQDASKNDLPFQRATADQTEQSLKKALESNSTGLQISAALTVREMKRMMPKRSFTSLVIPLMGILKNEKAEESVRTIAAMALHDLHSSRGDYAIKMLAEDPASPGIQKMCQWLSYYKMNEQKPEYATKEVE